MSSLYFRLNRFLDNGKNIYKVFFALSLILFIFKIHSLLISDIQPWDEGMYATRLLSIHLNGDFFDQYSHSVGKFYSASHPPLLIWTGYFVTLIFGVTAIALKSIIFILSLLSILLILLIGRELFSLKIAFYSSLIFCSNIIFTVFSQRFQFDIPYTFLILLSFYFLILYNNSGKFKYIIYIGVTFGACLMIKILVGFYIPIVILLSYLILEEKTNIKLKDIAVLSAIGVIIALPWHAYMLWNYGTEFTDYFLKFHIYDRAFIGVENSVKRSGVLYHINYMLTIIPYSILILFSFIKDFQGRKELDREKIFIWIWFLTGMLILMIFRTKLEVYILLILPPGCYLISLFIAGIEKEKFFIKALSVTFILLNFIWFATEDARPFIKEFILRSDFLQVSAVILILLVILYFLGKFIARRFDLENTYFIFILIFFLAVNTFYMIRIPEWENKFQITEVKELIEKSGKKNIIYVATNYRHNPQFSFYFNGLDLNWDNPQYNFVLIDNKEGIDLVKDKLSSLKRNDYVIIVEKDYINRADYPDSQWFIPGDFKLLLKSKGYELYEN
ncbi:MAG: glycosyltransferase family 39 protein [Ignavibacteria bacterium]|nr:glycosyltransferase family 39 protein [Ignavibacteria bacterium]